MAVPVARRDRLAQHSCPPSPQSRGAASGRSRRAPRGRKWLAIARCAGPTSRPRGRPEGDAGAVRYPGRGRGRAAPARTSPPPSRLPGRTGAGCLPPPGAGRSSGSRALRPGRLPTVHRFPALVGPVLGVEVVLAYRCGAAPEFHRVPSSAQANARAPARHPMAARLRLSIATAPSPARRGLARATPAPRALHPSASLRGCRAAAVQAERSGSSEDGLAPSVGRVLDGRRRIMPRNDLRNIAIVAHVDHGKTTLVDHMLRQSGAFRENEVVAERVMDSNDLERERGITILAKNTSVRYQGRQDQHRRHPRPLRLRRRGRAHAHDGRRGAAPRRRRRGAAAADALRALEVPPARLPGHRGHQQDRPRATPARTRCSPRSSTSSATSSASDAQMDFLDALRHRQVRPGQARARARGEGPRRRSSTPSSSGSPAPRATPTVRSRCIVCNTTHDDYVGRLAVGRMVRGTAQSGDDVALLGEGEQSRSNVQALRLRGPEARRGRGAPSRARSIAIAGLDAVTIGDTITDPAHPEALPRIVVEEPTIKMKIGVNTSTFAGKSKRRSS